MPEQSTDTTAPDARDVEIKRFTSEMVEAGVDCLYSYLGDLLPNNWPMAETFVKSLFGAMTRAAAVEPLQWRLANPMSDKQTTARTELPAVGSIWKARDGRLMRLDSWKPPDVFGRRSALMVVLNPKKGTRRMTKQLSELFGTYLTECKPQGEDHELR